MKERTGELTFKGTPLTVIGEKVEAGAPAPGFRLLDNDLNEVSLADSQGKVRLLSVVPSLDTGVCDEQARRFDAEVGEVGGAVQTYVISADLPFAQARWAKNAGVKNVQCLSDHREMSFGDAYGTHIKELRLEQRSVFVIDGSGTVVHAEYVPEVTQHPDYDAALEAVRNALK